MKVPAHVPLWVVEVSGVREFTHSYTCYTTKVEALRAYAERLDREVAGKADELMAAKEKASKAHAAVWSQEVKP